jgi:transcriptional regulator with XRE-family HTH domain
MHLDIPAQVALGNYLRSVRQGKGWTLRDVGEASAQEVSNAYLSQIENGKISKPSPQMLFSLATVYDVSYENLMERAGYIGRTRANEHAPAKHGRAATCAIDHLTAEEEQELLKHLEFMRWKRKSA